MDQRVRGADGRGQVQVVDVMARRASTSDRLDGAAGSTVESVSTSANMMNTTEDVDRTDGDGEKER